jgi:hypothetical protein
MKLSTETLNVLKNFSAINEGIEFKKGNTLKTMSSGKTVLAEASLKDSFTDEFCVDDLNEFLQVQLVNILRSCFELHLKEVLLHENQSLFFLDLAILFRKVAK